MTTIDAPPGDCPHIVLTLKLARSGLDVVIDGAQGAVAMSLEPREGETFDDVAVLRALLPSEARALAAVLVHAAEEAER